MRARYTTNSGSELPSKISSKKVKKVLAFFSKSVIIARRAKKGAQKTAQIRTAKTVAKDARTTSKKLLENEKKVLDIVLWIWYYMHVRPQKAAREKAP